MSTHWHRDATVVKIRIILPTTPEARHILQGGNGRCNIPTLQHASTNPNGTQGHMYLTLGRPRIMIEPDEETRSLQLARS
jgi:hypothetical protein